MPQVQPTRIACTTDMLNVGCGRRFHKDWVNIDLEPYSDGVMAHDINQGLPFSDHQFSAVYHSHVLEHLAPEDGKRLIRECFRVLKPGGVLRIVVPDLEQIAKLYLDKHAQAWRSQPAEDADYDWIKLELLDQLVRDQSGGMMGRYMSNGQIVNEAFVRSRLGDEFQQCRQAAEASHDSRAISVRISQSVGQFKKQMTRRLVRWIMGQEAQQAFDEGLFRRQGEVHRWMYDRYSLSKLCESIGFHDFEVCDAFTSRISGFQDYALDAENGRIRKPDSLFVECLA